MRILHVLLYAAMGGVENYTRDLFRTLEARGHSNVLVFDGAELPDLVSGGRAVYRLPGVADQSTATARRLDPVVTALLEETRPNVIYFHTTVNDSIGKRLVAALPSVYFAHNYAAICPSGALLYQRSDSICTLTDVPSWKCLVNAYAQQCNSRRPGTLLQSYRRARLTGVLTRRMDAIVCDSTYVASRHAQNGFVPHRLHVLPSPVPIPPLQESIRDQGAPSEPLVLFAGRVTPHKGLEYLVRAMEHLAPPARLLVVGDGYGLPDVRTLVGELGLQERIEFAGAVDRARMGDVYRRAAVLAVPSIWPEPFGMVGPEAMTYGLPVVAFPVGGITDWLVDGETGLFVAPRDSAALGAAIQRLLDDPALARRLGAAGRRRAEQLYTLDRHVDDLLRVFAAAIDARRSVTA